MSKPKFRVGQVVTWRGQTGQCFGKVIRITEPQSGNYVLWMDIGNGNKVPDQFPCNEKDVRPLTAREKGQRKKG